MNSTVTTNALLLVGVGFLGVIASHIAGTPLFGIAGFVAFLFAAATGVGALIRAIRDGYNSAEPRKESRPADVTYSATTRRYSSGGTREKRAADRYSDVPAA